MLFLIQSIAQRLKSWKLTVEAPFCCPGALKATVEEFNGRLLLHKWLNDEMTTLDADHCYGTWLLQKAPGDPLLLKRPHARAYLGWLERGRPAPPPAFADALAKLEDAAPTTTSAADHEDESVVDKLRALHTSTS